MDLSTESFLAALRRFIARRGRPVLLMTDNGTNFVGARRELEEVYKLLSTQKTQESVNQYLTDRKIEWLHTPARSPHFGGIWEAGVKQMKVLLHKTLCTHRLSCDELYTILTEVEAILNSHPLTPLDSAPLNGAQVLAHSWTHSGWSPLKSTTRDSRHHQQHLLSQTVEPLQETQSRVMG